MDEKLLEFTEKWKGKEVWHCPHIGQTISFSQDSAIFCCSSTSGTVPHVCDRECLVRKGLNKELYIEAVIREFENNQTNKGSCRGCEHLVKVPFDRLNFSNVQIRNIIYNHFKGCNSNCVYCGDTNQFEVCYDPLSMILTLSNEGALKEYVNVSFGGGEPTLLPNLDELISFGIRRDWPQILNTSALLYKDCIAEALKNKTFSMQVSVDAGTFETYQKVKGQSGFNIVWNNIEKYCQSDGRIFVKYIVFSYNSSDEDIEQFVKKCVQANVKNVSISAETSAVWKLRDDLDWEFGEKEISATAKMYKLLLEQNRAIYIYRENLIQEIYEAIMEKFIKIYLKPWLGNRSLCIWGMGVNGMALYDILHKFNVKVECFGDSYKAGEFYDGTKCVSFEELTEKNKESEMCVLVAINKYENIYQKLVDAISESRVKVINVE